ncbi:MAG: hypothetical protein JOZ32_00550 [Bryobacterales bacterium]|nr:hypothetical protein [Bryobacterales bacterium]
MRLRDVRRQDLQKLIGMMLCRGYSVQAAKHVKMVASAIYTHAQQQGWFSGPNLAKLVKLPEIVRADAHALSLEQLAKLLSLLPRTIRIMVFLAAITSMNIVEICGSKYSEREL